MVDLNQGEYLLDNGKLILSIIAAITKIFTHDIPVLLLNKTVIIAFVGPTARHCDLIAQAETVDILHSRNL